MFLLHNRHIIIVYLNNFQHNKRKGKHMKNAVTELLPFHSSGYSIILFSILSNCAMITFFLFVNFKIIKSRILCTYTNF